MNPNLSGRIKRFSLASLIALAMTVALLFLMTRLILPFEQDPQVVQAIRSIELQRLERIPDPADIRILEKLPTIKRETPPKRPETSAVPVAPFTEPGEADEPDIAETASERKIDWWAELRRPGDEADKAALRTWRLEQGYDPYVSITQGALPITNPFVAEPSPVAPDNGFQNVYGERELQVSDNCFMQIPLLNHDYSSFARNIPPYVYCKSSPKNAFRSRGDGLCLTRRGQQVLQVLHCGLDAGPHTFPHCKLRGVGFARAIHVP